MKCQSYMTEYAQYKISLEIKRLSLNRQLKIPIAKVNLNWFGSFLFMNINQKHKKDVPFIWALLHAAIDNHHNNIEESQLDITKNLFFL